MTYPITGCGIDLGTTDSVIAVSNGQTTQVIKNNRGQDSTPSVVSITKNAKTGELITLVGEPGKNNYQMGREAVLEFKYDMGSDRKYAFAKAGVERTPVQLSSEILKSLREDAIRAIGQEIDTAVITVPAVFPQPANAATLEAAKLAGFKQALTIQEPVAAAMGYGHQQEITENQYWLVFDFSDHTFDAALLRTRKGIFIMENHRGDNFLGSDSFDCGIFDRLVIPPLARDYALTGLRRGSKEWEYAVRLLKYAITQATVALHQQETVCLQGPIFEDEDGIEVDYSSINLSRADVVTVARPFIKYAVELCHEMLAENHLKTSDLAKVILVGGPTQASWFRDILKEYFGDIVDFSHNPVTVVAEGASIFAAQKQMALLLQWKCEDGFSPRGIGDVQ